VPTRHGIRRTGGKTDITGEERRRGPRHPRQSVSAVHPPSPPLEPARRSGYLVASLRRESIRRRSRPRSQVVRRRSAKPLSAVRIRPGPLERDRPPIEVAGFLFYVTCRSRFAHSLDPRTLLAGIERPRTASPRDVAETRPKRVARSAALSSGVNWAPDPLGVLHMTVRAPVLRNAASTALRIARPSQRPDATRRPGTPDPA
jgi:hypothetical protein